MNYQNKFNAAINFGLIVPFIEEDEAIHRCGTQAKPKSKNGWYVSYSDSLVMGDWQTNVTKIWKPEGQQRNYKDNRQIKEAIERSKQCRQDQQAQTANDARQQYFQAKTVVKHSYLSAKNIDPVDGLKLSGQWLLVPLFDLLTNKIMNLQRIAPDGTKLFLKGGQVSGLASPIGIIKGDLPQIYICEGYATAATLYKVTGVPVIAAMNANNLLPVAKAVKQKWPDTEIVIAADDDWLTEQKTGINPGKVKAIEAAHQTGSKVSFPPFTLEDKRAGLTDWNDYYLARSNKAAA